MIISLWQNTIFPSFSEQKQRMSTIACGDLNMQFMGSANFILSSVFPKPLVKFSSILLLTSRKFPPKSMPLLARKKNQFLPDYYYFQNNDFIRPFYLAFYKFILQTFTSYLLMSPNHGFYSKACAAPEAPWRGNGVNSLHGTEIYHSGWLDLSL